MRATMTAVTTATATEIAPGPSTTVPSFTSTTPLEVRNFAEDDSYPSLGVYVSAHFFVTARESQAYAFGSGRPLALDDPRGLAPGETWKRHST